MRVYNKIGSKERLFEMFEKVNKIKLNESTATLEVPKDGYGNYRKWKEEYKQYGPSGYGSHIPAHKAPYQADDMDNSINAYRLYHRIAHLTGNIDYQEDDLHDNADIKLLNNIYQEILRRNGDLRNVKDGDIEKAVFDIEDSIFNESKKPIKEEQANEIGLDHPTVQGILNYLKKNPIQDREELDLGNGMVMVYDIDVIDWDDVPYYPATRMQPEEGGYPENIKAELVGVTIYDQDDNEYVLSDDALNAINSEVDFDGDAYDYIEKIASEGGEDEYSRGDWERDDRLANESVNETPDNPELGSIKYNYDQNGNWIPEGYEDKKVALRAVEQPLGSGNWKVAVVQLDVMGDIEKFLTTKDSWDEAKDALHASIT